MAWYDDKKKTTHVAHDKDVERAEREGREAAAKGWVVQETTVAPERVAVGRAITRGLFTAGAGLLKGRPRKGGKVTMTDVRAPVPRGVTRGADRKRRNGHPAARRPHEPTRCAP